MQSIRRTSLALALAVVLCHPAHGQSLARVQEALYGQTMADAVKELGGHLERNPKDDTLRFGLAIAQFLESGERLFGAMYRHGLNPGRGPFGVLMPFRVPAALDNPKPEPISHDQCRAIISDWADAVRRVDDTLAEIDARDLKLPLAVGLIRIDFDASGSAEDDEALWLQFGQVQRRFRPTPETAETFKIAFDRGDVSWLRGYCHILMAVGDLVLAHDTSELFDRAGHVLFPKAEVGYEFLTRPSTRMEWFYVDLASFIHLINLPVKDTKRVGQARRHLLEALEHARQMWRFYDAETDNDAEWVPNPKQEAAIPGARLDAEMRETWLHFLDEAELILEGKHLLRFWRLEDGMNREEGVGINLKRVFTEPRALDLVLWLQGTAAAPYLENGTLTEPRLWARMQRVFDRRFFRYAFWCN